MRRREVIAGLLLPMLVGGALAQGIRKSLRLAVISPADAISDLSETSGIPGWRAFFAELKRLGWVEGANLVIDRRSGEGRPERFGDIARDVVRLEPDVIFTLGSPMVRALRDVTTTIPIVAYVFDPVGNGYAASLARPGGNVTGTSDGGLEVHEKYLQLLAELNPRLSKVAFLVTRLQWDGSLGSAMREAAGGAGISLIGPPLESPIEAPEYRRVFDLMLRDGAEALIVGTVNENYVHWRLIVELAAQKKLVVLYTALEPVTQGQGLIAYAEKFEDAFTRDARYVDLILKGAKPGELPFYRAQSYFLAINLKTAKALGVTIPPSILIRADEVIE